MAISSLTITQDNTVNFISVYATHSPLIFICEALYTGSPPEQLQVQVKDEDDVLLGTFLGIPNEDITGTRRNFLFVADSILQGYMDSFEDTQISNGSLIHQENAQKIFKIVFTDGVIEAEHEFIAVHAARQYGDTEALVDIVTNEDDTYYAAEGMPFYCYVWNDSDGNVITIDTPLGGDLALDYDDTIFTDYDGKWFRI